MFSLQRTEPRVRMLEIDCSRIQPPSRGFCLGMVLLEQGLYLSAEPMAANGTIEALQDAAIRTNSLFSGQNIWYS